LSVDIANTGTCSGDEAVQIYLQRADNPQAPIKQLIGFRRVSLDAGQKVSVRFTIHAGQLGSYDEAIRYVLPAGEVELLVGTSSETLPLSASVKIPEEMAGKEVEKVFFSDSVIA
jgi:beta-glucosidase